MGCILRINSLPGSMLFKANLDSAFETVVAALFLAFRADEIVCPRFRFNCSVLTNSSYSCPLHLILQHSLYIQTSLIIFSLLACFTTSDGDSQL